MSFSLTVQTAQQIAAARAIEGKEACAAAIDRLVEGRARDLGYNSAAHLAGYAQSTNPEWAAEALLFIAWRDRVWEAALGVLQQAEETGAMPSVAEVLAALPEPQA